MDCGAESYAEPLADADGMESDPEGSSQEDAAEVSKRPALGFRV